MPELELLPHDRVRLSSLISTPSLAQHFAIATKWPVERVVSDRDLLEAISRLLVAHEILCCVPEQVSLVKAAVPVEILARSVIANDEPGVRYHRPLWGLWSRMERDGPIVGIWISHFICDLDGFERLAEDVSNALAARAIGQRARIADYNKATARRRLTLEKSRQTLDEWLAPMQRFDWPSRVDMRSLDPAPFRLHQTWLPITPREFGELAKALETTPTALLLEALMTAWAQLGLGRRLLIALPASSRPFVSPQVELGDFASMIPLLLDSESESPRYDIRMQIARGLSRSNIPVAEISEKMAVEDFGAFRIEVDLSRQNRLRLRSRGHAVDGAQVAPSSRRQYALALRDAGDEVRLFFGVRAGAKPVPADAILAAITDHLMGV